MNRAALRVAWSAAVAVVLLLTVAPWPSRSALPTTIGYQGSLTDASGTPVTATLDMVFSLYDSPAAATPLWSETQSVAVASGVFNVRLGSVTPFPAGLFTGPLYLGVKVGTDAEMTPRLPFDTAPFAFGAEQLVACAPGQTNCGGACVDLQSDTDNCGTCGTTCAGDETCVGGTCTVDPDADGDGWTVGGGDCDDGNPNVNPGAAEVCNDIDDDCDDSIDESGASLCSDGSPCTTDICAAGVCQFTPVDCSGLSDACNTGVCYESTGACVAQPVADGVACDDADACSVEDQCLSGVCIGGTPLDCGVSTICATRFCDSATGCGVEFAPAGTVCGPGLVCNASGSCVPL